jgi:mono/diheme cytochrome c family protein
MATNSKKPERWAEMKAWLLDDLADDERLYVARWIATYVNRWGQVPIASSRAASKAYEKPQE